MGTRARRFFARFNRLELSAPLVEVSSGNPELLGQLIDAFTALHPLYGHALKLPGISLSSLHCCFLSRRVCPSRVCQFKGSFQHRLINFACERIREGQKYEEGQEYGDFLEGYPCVFPRVDPSCYGGLLNFTIWYYQGSHFPVLQLGWPDKAGLFPWDLGFDERFGNDQLLR
jgi:hypothetical protein